MQLQIRGIFAAAFTALAIATNSYANDPLKSVRNFTAKIENDIIGGTDSRYTSGIEFTWANFNVVPRGSHFQKIKPLAQLGRFLLQSKNDAIITGSSLSVGQKIFTPKQVREKELIHDDRPYAGWLYLNFGYHEKSPVETKSISLSIGTVGPESLAGDFQKGFHQLIGDHVPEGWKNQIGNKKGVNLVSRFEKKLFRKNLLNEGSIEIAGLREITLGTVNTGFRSGFSARVGRRLPDVYTVSRIQNSGLAITPSNYTNYINLHFDPHRRFYWTGGANVSYVGRNLLIEGNGPNGNPNINKSDFVGEVELGFVKENKNLRLSFNYVYRTKEFKEQQGGQAFGSLALTFF